MQLDSVDGAHFSSVAVSVSRMYARSLDCTLRARPAVVRRAWKRTIRVPGGAAKVQPALALQWTPGIRGVHWIAEVVGRDQRGEGAHGQRLHAHQPPVARQRQQVQRLGETVLGGHQLDFRLGDMGEVRQEAGAEARDRRPVLGGPRLDRHEGGEEYRA